MTSLFILGYSMHKGAIQVNVTCKVGLIVFILGIVLNELTLMIQGFAAMNYISIPHVNELLFFIAFVLFTGLVILTASFKKTIFDDSGFRAGTATIS